MNDKLRLVKNLLEKRRVRRKERQFVVEGPHLVEEAGELIRFVVYSAETPQIRSLKEKGAPCLKVSHKQFGELSGVETHQGILAVVTEQEFKLLDMVKGRQPLIVFCVAVQDPGNLGTIIRTADAVNAAGVILSKGTVDLYNAKVIRATMGSLFHLPIVEADDSLQTLQILKKKQMVTVATALAVGKPYFAVDYRKPTVIMIGNEGSGLPEALVRQADETVNIPMPGKAESLNAGVSSAVVLYEALRQRTT